MSTITMTLSEWAGNLKFEDLTPDAIDAAKRFLYDSIGCGLGGYQQEDCKMHTLQALWKHHQLILIFSLA